MNIILNILIQVAGLGFAAMTGIGTAWFMLWVVPILVKN